MDYRVRMSETPFGRETRQNIRDGYNVAYATGGRDRIIIPRVGYVARCRFHFNGTLTVTLGGGTAALDVLGPWNAVSRLKFTANSGQDIYSTSGYGAFLVNSVMIGQKGYFPEDDMWFGAAPGYSGRVFQAATASGANTWDFGLTLPLALNEESEIGLILVQNETAQNTVQYEWNGNVYSLTATVAPVLVTGAATATLTGTFGHVVEYFAIPVNQNAQPDITWIHEIQEVVSGGIILGENRIPMLRENMYYDLLHHVILNNAPNTVDVDRIALQLNRSDTIIDLQNRNALQLYRMMYHRDLPVGTFVYPLSYQGFPGFGGRRDLLNGRATSELDSLVTIAAGATLGTSPTISTIRRQLVELVVPPTRVA
jgi:hypothetical protein